MTNKNSNVPYDQIPHIVLNHPNAKPDHWAIMIVLYKLLKDKKYCIYPNEAIAENSRISLRTVERRISELKKMFLITSIGTSYNRRISLGLLFNTTASVADKNLTPPPKSILKPLPAKPLLSWATPIQPGASRQSRRSKTTFTNNHQKSPKVPTMIPVPVTKV